ncbi:MAG: DUF1275 domain-containing protein [Bacteroidetes bacterium]|nr:DUF1275 domain-containing protein [Bacteroidota bacterium]
MLHHHGQTRTLRHNLQLAGLLSFVAGVVNVCGFFAVETLTTNVTGHFAFFAQGMLRRDYAVALEYLAFIFAFFLGSVFASALVEFISRRNARFVYLVPVAIEITIITIAALVPVEHNFAYTTELSCCLLFAMGLQNSLVTIISSAVVRTTHLTGLFTDLGIEVGQLFFYHEADKRRKLRASIGLRFTIITAFFGGCTAGGITYSVIGLDAMLIASAVLAGALIYDGWKYARAQ